MEGVAYEDHEEVDLLEQCKRVRCKAGRECRVLSTGAAECVCRDRCPVRDHPVCGSDGVLYENHCELHRQACLAATHIRPEVVSFDTGSTQCTNNPWAKFKRKLQKEVQEIRQKEDMKIKVPRACHQNDRDRTREMLVSWVRLVGSKFIKEVDPNSISAEELMRRHFGVIDREAGDANGYVDSDEWLKYFQQRSKLGKTHQHHHRRRQSHLEKLRKLCFEALVEEGDRNQDWRLSEGEFTSLMDSEYKPSRKYCKREKRNYEDGTKIKVDCNGCTCSCGKWICTSKLCQEEHPFSKEDMSENDFYNYADMDNIF